MIENCLRHKIIRDFLKHYTENRWKDLIPSLIEIGILNLQKSFNKIIFTNDELKNFSHHLQISQIEKDKERSKENFKENKDNKEKDTEKSCDIKNGSKEKEEEKVDRNKLIKSQSKTKETPKNVNGEKMYNANNNIQRMKMIDIVQNNPEKQEKMKSCIEAIIEMKNNIKNNYQYFKNNISIDFKNKLTKQKGEYYKKINVEKNRINTKKHIDKVSYAISYDKDLRPASISKKINNTQNNMNSRNNKAEYDNTNYYKFIQNYSSEKKSKKSNNNSKSKSKKYKNNEKYMNINLNNLNRINNMHNVKRKHYNVNRANNKNEIVRTSGNEKNNYYKKLSIMQSHNLANNDTNNNYHVVKVDRPQINKMKGRKNTLNNISNSYNNNYRNINFINTLYQRVNSNGQAIKIINDNYFSNRDELNEFIRKNRIKLNVKQEVNNRKNITKSEKPSDRKNNFLNLDDNEKSKEKEIFSDGRHSKNNVQNKTNKKDSNIQISNKNEIVNKNELIRSYPNNKDFMKLNKKNSTTLKNTISTEKERDTIFNTKNKINDIEDKTNIKKNNDISEERKEEQKKIENKNENNIGLKTIKLFDLNKDKNSEKKLFEKAKGKNGDRYFNIFGYEPEEISLTQIEKDYSGIIDSSTSNEIQMNPDYFFKETPRNVFKINKSSDHSINSNNIEG